LLEMSGTIPLLSYWFAKGMERAAASGLDLCG